MITSSHPLRAIRRRQEGLDFWTGQVADQFLVRPLHRNREHTGDHPEALWITQGHKAEKGTDGR